MASGRDSNKEFVVYWILCVSVIVGDGSYSSVYKVLRKENNTEYALKKVKI